jgi:spore coat polysaccharide biosynthesis predicted glycosyltransferase SpsG
MGGLRLTGVVSFVADAPPRTGLGHLSRCSAVALALRARGVATACYALGADTVLQRDGIEWTPLADTTPPAGEVIVADTYVLSASELERIAGGRPLVLMHENGDLRGATLAVDTTLEPDGHPSHLFGFPYACLRPMFWGVERTSASGVVQSVLVTMGAADTAGVSASIASTLIDSAPDVTVRVVRGPHAGFDPPQGVEVLDAPASMLGPLLAADLVVCSAGQTSLEAAAAGTPAITVTTAENQAPNAELLQALGVSRSVAAGDADDLRDQLSQLLDDADLRRNMSETGRRTVDGFGALRVAFRIAELTG